MELQISHRFNGPGLIMTNLPDTDEKDDDEHKDDEYGQNIEGAVFQSTYGSQAVTVPF